MIQTIKTALYFIKRHSGTICAIGAAASAAVTAYFSGKAAVKTYIELDPDTDLTLKTKIYAKNYLKPAISYLVTVGLIAGSDRLHVRTEIGLLAGVAMWKDRHQFLNKSLKDNVSEETYNDIIHKEAVYDTIGKGSEKKLWFYEPVSGQYIQTTYTKYLESMLETNLRLQADSMVSLSTIVDYLGGTVSTDTDSYIWSFDVDVQQYNWGFDNYGPTVRLCRGSEKQLEKWLKSNKEMTKNDAIDLTFNIDPEDRRLLEFDSDCGLYVLKEEVPFELENNA